MNHRPKTLPFNLRGVALGLALGAALSVSNGAAVGIAIGVGLAFVFGISFKRNNSGC